MPVEIITETTIESGDGETRIHVINDHITLKFRYENGTDFEDTKTLTPQQCAELGEMFATAAKAGGFRPKRSPRKPADKKSGKK